MNSNDQPTDDAQRIPPPGTMAYAQWKRQQEAAQQKKMESQEPGKPASQPGNQQAGQAALRLPSQEPSQEVAQPREHPAKGSTRKPTLKPAGVLAGDDLLVAGSVLTKRLKPIRAEEPIRKITFMVTPDEAELLEELKLHLRRRLKVKATKNDIVRAAIRLVSQDFAKNRKASFLASKLGER